MQRRRSQRKAGDWLHNPPQPQLTPTRPRKRFSRRQLKGVEYGSCIDLILLAAESEDERLAQARQKFGDNVAKVEIESKKDEDGEDVLTLYVEFNLAKAKKH